MLALFNSNGLDRWWQTRMCLGQLMGQLTDLALLVGTYVRPQMEEGQSEEEFAIITGQAKKDRETIVRWINLMHILAYRQARNIHDLSDLVEDTRYNPSRQWMTVEELNILQKKGDKDKNEKAKFHIRKTNSTLPFAGFVPSNLEPETPLHRVVSYAEIRKENERAWNSPLFFASQELMPVKDKLMSRYMIVLYWCERLVTKLSEEKLLHPARPEALWKLQDCLNSIRIAISTIFTYLYCKIPFIYVQLLTFMVKLYLLVVAIIAGSNMRMAKSWCVTFRVSAAASACICLTLCTEACNITPPIFTQHSCPSNKFFYAQVRVHTAHFACDGVQLRLRGHTADPHPPLEPPRDGHQLLPGYKIPRVRLENHTSTAGERREDLAPGVLGAPE